MEASEDYQYSPKKLHFKKVSYIFQTNLAFPNSKFFYLHKNVTQIKNTSKSELLLTEILKKISAYGFNLYKVIFWQNIHFLQRV